MLFENNILLDPSTGKTAMEPTADCQMRSKCFQALCLLVARD